MGILEKIKEIWKNIGTSKKSVRILDLITIVSFILIFYGFNESKKSEENIINNVNSSTSTITLGQKEIKELMLTDKISDWNVNSCPDIVDNLKTKFPELTCLSPIKTEYCASQPTIENSTLLIDGCDIAYKKIDLPDSGYAIRIRFKSSWNANIDSIHYLFDNIGGDNPERNRISLYVQNGYLKYSILNEYGTEEHMMKLKLENNSAWNEKEFNTIEIGWVKDQNRMFLEVNGNEYNKVVGNISLNTSNSIMFLGSAIFGNYQADGYFDYWFVRKYIYPEPTVSIGAEQRIS
ncbi:MAG: hypothetical protein ABIF85_00925 [Nanoarchaeota archaeon]|nr:hypothetical protein [Nanoarchaeota archaeon]MBU4300487.1 hypothetical protein [Nanoarchaeota archaeon]MBU4451967.1 hypothetical protein [Nanoarchaeota archaeon]MCG2724127.1 hypothetical protein [archaeon]